MANTNELLLRITAQLDRTFGNAVNSATIGVLELGEKVTEATKRVDKLNKVVKGRREVELMAQRFDKAQARVEALAQEMAQATNPSVTLQRSYAKATQVAEHYKTQLDELNRSLELQEKAAQTAGMSIQELSNKRKAESNALTAQTDAIEKVAQQDARLLDSQETAMNRRMEGLAQIAEGMVVFDKIKAPLDSAMSFETQTKELQKYTDLADDLMQINLQKSQNSALSYGDMADIQAAGLQAGIVDANNVDEIVKYTDLVNNAALAFDMTGESAGTAFAAIQSQITGSIAETERMFDVVNAISNVSNSSASDLLTVIQRSGGIVKNFTALSTEQIAALSAAFRASSASADEAATSQASFIAALTKGKGASTTQIEGFERLGINAEALTQKLLTGPQNAQEAIEQLFDSLRALDETERADVMTKIFGGDKGLLNAVASILGQTDVLLGKPLEVASNEQNFNGSMAKEAAIQAETVANQQKIFQNNIEALKTIVGQSLLPIWNEVLGVGIKALQFVSDLARENPGLIKSIAYIVAGFISLKFALGSVVIAFSSVQTMITRGLIIANNLRKAYLVFNGVIKSTGFFMTALSKIVGSSIKGFKTLKLAILGGGKALIRYTKNMALAIASVIKFSAIGLKNLVLWLAKSAASLAVSSARMIALGVASLATSAKIVATRVALMAYTAAVGASSLALKAYAAGTAAVSVAMTAFAGVAKGLRIAMAALNVVIRANPLGIILTVIGALIAAGVWLWQNWDLVKTKLTELWAKFGEIFPGIATFVTNAFNLISNTIQGVLDFIINLVSAVFAGDWQKAWDLITGIFSSVWEGIKNLGAQAVDWLIGKVMGLVNTVKDGFNAVLDFFGIGDDKEVKVTKQEDILQKLETNTPAIAQAERAQQLQRPATFDPAQTGAQAVTAVTEPQVRLSETQAPVMVQTEQAQQLQRPAIFNPAQTGAQAVMEVAGPQVRLSETQAPVMVQTEQAQQLQRPAIFNPAQTGAQAVMEVAGPQVRLSETQAPVMVQTERAQQLQRPATFDPAQTGVQNVISVTGQQAQLVQNQTPVIEQTNVPFLAEGGIVSQPTLALIGEGQESEVVMPLSKLEAFVNQPEINQPANQNQTQSIVINFNPVINLQGNSGQSGQQDPYAEVKRALSEGATNLRRELLELLRREGRLSYD